MESRRPSGTRERIWRVLVVDDDEDVRELYAEVLRFSGFAVQTAVDAETALLAIRTTRPDVLVIDYALPQIDGFELCRMLKASAETQAIPVIILTGYDGALWRSLALEAGVNRFLTKPVGVDVLESAIRELLLPARRKLTSIP